jgi:hypothetical protein
VGIICPDENCMQLWEGCRWYVRLCCLFGGKNALTLVSNVSFLCFLRLWKMFVDILDIDEGPGAVVPITDGC